MIKMTFAGATHEGMVRTNNEDAFICQNIWDEQHVLCVAIDGLGGYEGGEIAAGIAKDTIISYLNENRMGDSLDLLKQAVTQANNDIVTHQSQTPDCNRMGCVLTAGLFDLEAGRLNVAHVGDSRLYQWYEGTLRKLTHDHSLVGYREDAGMLTEEEAMNHPQRNVVERILGDKVHHLEDKGFIEAAIFPLNDGMRFIFCSDGLTVMSAAGEISLIVQNHLDDLEGCVNALIKSACDHGGKDNVTVVMSCYCNDASTATIIEEQRQPAEDDTHKVVPPVFRGAETEKPQEETEERPQQSTTDATVASTAGEDVPEEPDPNQETEEPKRRFSWRTVLWLAMALAACLAALYGGYRLGYRSQYLDLDRQIAERDSTIVKLQDSIRHLEQEKYDQSVKLDSLNNTTNSGIQ